MSSSRVANWLDQKIVNQRRLCALGVLASLAIGAIVLYLTFWTTYGLLWFTLTNFVRVSPSSLLGMSAGFLVLLFIGNATTSREYLDKIELNLGPHRDLQVGIARATGYGWTLVFTDAKAARSFVKMLTTLLFTGPRAVEQSFRLIKRAVVLGKIDRPNVAKLIARGFRAEERVAFSALEELLPAPELVRLIPQLAQIDGVVLLPSDPPGFTLSPALMEELREFRS